MNQLTKKITIVNFGKNSFPIYVVYAEYEDANGYCQEELSEELARFSNLKDAKEFAANI
jgi:hypothetical protein